MTYKDPLNQKLGTDKPPIQDVANEIYIVKLSLPFIYHFDYHATVTPVFINAEYMLVVFLNEIYLSF